MKYITMLALLTSCTKVAMVPVRDYESPEFKEHVEAILYEHTQEQATKFRLAKNSCKRIARCLKKRTELLFVDNFFLCVLADTNKEVTCYQEPL